jgi:4-amino-4-deoxy-L-arabinose transferase-like glycosyltransferase
MIAGQGFRYGHLNINYYSFACPLYPWITAAGYWLFGSIVPVMLTQMAAGAALAVVTSLITERLYSGWIAALVAGILVAFHPGLVIYSATKAHPLTFDALFFALALLQSFRLAERPSLRRFVGFGVIVGLGILSRATIIIFLPVTGTWLLLAIMPKREWKSAIRNLIVAGLCTMVIIVPWTIRNSLLHHQFVFLLTTGGENFWRGNNEHATGNSYVGAGTIVLNTLSPEERLDLKRQPDEIAQSNWFATRARAFIRTHPVLFVRITFLKLFHFWWFAPQTGEEYPATWLHLYAIYYVLVLFSFVVGLWRIIRLGPPATRFTALIIAFMLALSIFQSLYYVEGRHRWAIEPMILAIAGVGFATLMNRTVRRRVNQT